MTTRRLLLAVSLAALAPALARAATSEPHGWAVDDGVSCTSCHVLHNAPGVSLTKFGDNYNLCASCHNAGGGIGAKFGWPWYSTYQATPLAAQPAGRSHRWDAAATNAALGAQPPVGAALLAKLDTTTTPGTPRLQCSTCHDEHNANPQFGATQHVSVDPNTDLNATNPGTAGTAKLRVLTPAAAAAAKAYVIQIVGPGAVGVATYRISNDGGRTWLGWNASPPGWVAWSTSAPNPRVTGPTQSLNDSTNVQVTFGGAGTFNQNDSWTFYVGYSMLRASIVASAMCEDCHRSRVHTSQRARGEDPAYAPDGVRVFSHPVGVQLGMNGGGYDRAVPLRVNGTAQAGALQYGDLPMSVEASIEKVRCLTCHKVHEAHSNSILQ